MMFKIIASAFKDISSTVQRRSLWTALATEDVNDQHKRTTLGPLWLLLNYLLFVVVLLFVFGRGEGSDFSLYVRYLATGFFVWFHISEVLSQSTTLFMREAGFIKGTPLPLGTYVMRLTMQSLIRSSYSFVGWIGLLVLVSTPLSPTMLWAVLGLIIIVSATPAAIAIFAFVGAFFPDVQFVMTNLVRIGMFLTPIFWGLDDVSGTRGLLYHWNPFTYFLEIVRVPIVFGEAPWFALGFCMAITAGLWCIAFLLLGRFRRQIPMVI